MNSLAIMEFGLENRGDMPPASALHSAFDLGQKLVIIGGQQIGSFDNYYCFSTTKNTWSKHQFGCELPHLENFSVAHKKKSEKIYIFGGISHSEE